MCDINGHIIRITLLTALDIEDEEFDIRDITLESEINHLVSNFSEIIVLQNMEGLDDLPLQFLDLYKKLYFLYFRSFGIEDSLQYLFNIYYKLSSEIPKINLPEDTVK